MTAVTAVTAAASTPSIHTPQSTAGAPKQTMDSDMFLKLLVTQLQNQDPSSPMDTNQMITQTTQLASMQQMTALSQTQTQSFALSQRTAAAALIGEQVGYLDANGNPATGKVTAVSFTGSTPTVTVDGTPVDLTTITGVSAATTN